MLACVGVRGVQDDQQWLCHAVPCHAKPCPEQAEQGRFLLVLGRSRSRPACSGITQLWLPHSLSEEPSVLKSPVPYLGIGQGTRTPAGSGGLAPDCGCWHGGVTAPVSHDARLRGTAALLACLQHWHWGSGVSPYSGQGVYGPAGSKLGRAADGTTGWPRSSS